MKFQKIVLGLILSCMSAYADLKKDIVYGIYCGECDDNCSYFVKQSNEKYFEDSSDVYFSNIDKFYKQTNFKVISDEVFTKPINVPDVESVLRKYDSVIGQPDAYDQCGYFIEIRKQGESQRYLIDPDYNSPEIQKILDQVFTYEFEKRKLKIDYTNWPEMYEFQLNKLDSIWNEKVKKKN